MNNFISKKLFVETIKAIEFQLEIDRKCSKAFKTILSNDYVSGYDNSILLNQLVKILQEATNDIKAHSWIEYYIWELECGKKYKDGCCFYVDGSLIDLSNGEKLFEFLKKNNS